MLRWEGVIMTCGNHHVRKWRKSSNAFEMLIDVQKRQYMGTGNEQKRNKCDEDEAAITVHTEHLEHAKKKPRRPLFIN